MPLSVNGADAPAADREKRHVAVTSLYAAVFITVTKLVVGIMTASLGILAEAAHSALDLAAALVTFLAIRAAAKPPDSEHLYGHGKIENLSALFETFLLLVTCAWIFLEAGRRILAPDVYVEVNVWSFAVMFLSIVINYSRSRALMRVARKYGSQALEADALHFQTDIWSSWAVIAGLACVLVAGYSPRIEFLHHADTVAAVIVGAIVVWVSISLGLRTAQSLLDTAPRGMDRRIRALVDAIPGVTGSHKIRVRSVGPRLFVDVHIYVESRQTLADAHALTETVERAIQQVAPGADVTVHPEPRQGDRGAAGSKSV